MSRLTTLFFALTALATVSCFGQVSSPTYADGLSLMKELGIKVAGTDLLDDYSGEILSSATLSSLDDYSVKNHEPVTDHTGNRVRMFGIYNDKDQLVSSGRVIHNTRADRLQQHVFGYLADLMSANKLPLESVSLVLSPSRRSPLIITISEPGIENERAETYCAMISGGIGVIIESAGPQYKNSFREICKIMENQWVMDVLYFEQTIRAKKILQAIGCDMASRIELSNAIQAPFKDGKWQSYEDLSIEYEPILWSNYTGTRSWLSFMSGVTKREVIHASIFYCKSAADAQLAIVSDLLNTSMPDELLVRGLRPMADGPGEMALQRGYLDKAAGEVRWPDPGFVAFYRGNIGVILDARDKTSSVFPLAREMDGMIVAAMAKAEAAEQAAKSQGGAEGARAGDGAAKKPEAGASKAGEASLTPATEPGKP